MNSARKILSLVISLLIAAAFAGGAAQSATFSPKIYYPVIPSGMTLAGAVNDLQRTVAQGKKVWVDLSREQGIVAPVKCKVSNNRIDFLGQSDPRLSIGVGFYSLMGQTIVVETDRKGVSIIALPGLIKLRFSKSDEARKVADALYAIQQEVKSYRNRLEAQLADFEPVAAQYRSLAVKPQISEEQRKLIVQANSLTDQKEYFKARDKYREAMELEPTSYPAAYYNLALLDAQMNLPFSAILYMKHYLLLAPDAADARSAQDKIYEWELMLPSEQVAGSATVHTRGYLGAWVQSPDEGQPAASVQKTGKGVLVIEVLAGSPAMLGDIKEGDVIRTFDGRSIEAVSDLLSTVAATPVGKTVGVGIRRQEQDLTLNVTIVSTPE